MKLNINEIYHNYITRVIIFSLFTHKRLVRQENVFKLSCLSFVKKRIPWKINLIIDIEPRFDKREERDIIIENILNDKNEKFLPIITIKFLSPLKETIMIIDLSEEEKYNNFLYS
jgi:hypothetical protein